MDSGPAERLTDDEKLKIMQMAGFVHRSMADETITIQSFILAFAVATFFVRFPTTERSSLLVDFMKLIRAYIPPIERMFEDIRKNMKNDIHP